MKPATAFRAAASRVYAVVTWVVAVIVLAAFVANGGLGELVAYGALPLLLAVIGWAAFWRPVVLVEDDGVRVVNVLSTTWLPWEAITGTRTRWGLELTTHDGKVGAWALPARSAVSRWRATKRDQPVVSSDRRLHTATDGGGDPHIAAERVEEHMTGHLVDAGSARRPERHLEVAPTALLLVATGLAVLTVIR